MRIRKFFLHFLVVFVPVVLLYLFSFFIFEILEPFDLVKYSVAQDFRLGYKSRLNGHEYWYMVNGEKNYSIVPFGYDPFTKQEVTKHTFNKKDKYVVRFSQKYIRETQVLLHCKLHDSVKSPEIPWDTIPTSLLIKR